MSRNLTLSKNSLVSLLEAGFPAPDDSGPIGPFGPIIRERLSWALLNPQPLPPGPPDPLRRARLENAAGPSPDPWRTALLARTLIDQTLAQLGFAQLLGAAQSESAVKGVRSRIKEMADEFCGTVPHHFPLPHPWPPKFDFTRLTAIDILVVGVQFQRTADAMTNNPLQADFAAAADQLLETGLKRFESQPGYAAAAAG